MRLFLILTAVPALCLVAKAAEIKSSHSGPWSQASTWSGHAIPGAGDVALISNGHTITVNDARVVGPSGPPGTIAIRLNNTGSIEISAGGILSVRGDTRFTGDPETNGKDSVTVQAGGVWEFDSSQSPKTSYTFGSEPNGGFRRFVVAGNAKSPASVRSKDGGANGHFVLNGRAGGSLLATYATFINIGDKTTPAWQIAYEGSGNHFVKWQVTNSTFTGCGAITSMNDVGMDLNGTFIHNYNIHRNTPSSEIFTHWFNINVPAPGTGTRELNGNLFDASLSRTQFYPAGFTISGNYFGEGTVFGGYNAWASWTNNFVRYSDVWAATGSGTAVMGDVNNSYFFADSDWGNPHVLTGHGGFASNLNGIIFGQAGTALGPPGPRDSGELWFLVNPNPPATYGIYNSLILPNMAGYSSLEIGSVLSAYPNMRAIAEHNTWFGGWTRGPGGFPAIMVGEPNNGASASVTSFRDNILWNPQLTGYKSGFFKLADISHSPAPTVDYCAPANCDYNSGYGHNVTDSASSQYTNQGKGYAAKFSSPPGVHDVDGDPKFFDWQRSVELFDSKYLGNKPPIWAAAAAAAYKEGDFVQSSDPSVYWSLPVNYRYVNGGPCNKTNPKPGKGPNWRSCWEWASLYRLRQAVALHQEDMLATMMQWVRAGYVPSNPALLDAGHDGFDIGAVQSCSSRRMKAIAGCAPFLKK
ncbi:MAG: hypothetical protein QOJ99_2353 [Bryobacterales bacterium]|nr:hypothetical protein [Bryobacterales bacterium]